MHKAKYPQASEKFAFVAELYGLYPALISSQTFCVGPSQMMCCKSVIETLLLPHFLQVFLVYMSSQLATFRTVLEADTPWRQMYIQIAWQLRVYCWSQKNKIRR